MSSGLVLYETANRIATITLNRPEVMNAIVSPMWQEINDALASADRDCDVRVIPLKGTGRAF